MLCCLIRFIAIGFTLYAYVSQIINFGGNINYSGEFSNNSDNTNINPIINPNNTNNGFNNINIATGNSNGFESLQNDIDICNAEKSTNDVSE